MSSLLAFRFLEFDLTLNVEGASALLGIVEKEDKDKAIKEFVGQTIQKLMAAQFSGTNELMQELTEAPKKVVKENGIRREVIDIQQGSHQGIYLKNLIGPLVGVSQGLNFDRHTGVLYDKLINQERDDVLKTLFEHVTPESFVTGNC